MRVQYCASKLEVPIRDLNRPCQLPKWEPNELLKYSIHDPCFVFKFLKMSHLGCSLFDVDVPDANPVILDWYNLSFILPDNSMIEIQAVSAPCSSNECTDSRIFRSRTHFFTVPSPTSRLRTCSSSPRAWWWCSLSRSSSSESVFSRRVLHSEAVFWVFLPSITTRSVARNWGWC